MGRDPVGQGLEGGQQVRHRPVVDDGGGGLDRREVDDGDPGGPRPGVVGVDRDLDPGVHGDGLADRGRLVAGGPGARGPDAGLGEQLRQPGVQRPDDRADRLRGG
ncbi:hypothetical protein [Streptomyces sp. G-5]|uniref:hypothetical protein n=1 Tax=Streptomyces sp. G-5 TaxID=2977231 RepID=UPI0021CE26A6|nr:hypothetical protein [Streptomyces sp. G-5]MCU4747516.1 hypothetical protein [Streptomyces sp. G-5]